MIYYFSVHYIILKIHIYEIGKKKRFQPPMITESRSPSRSFSSYSLARIGCSKPAEREPTKIKIINHHYPHILGIGKGGSTRRKGGWVKVAVAVPVPVPVSDVRGEVKVHSRFFRGNWRPIRK